MNDTLKNTFKPEGIKKGYPLIRKRIGRLTGYIQLCRPFTLLAPFLVGLFGVLTPGNLTLAHVITGIYVGVTLALAQACGQCLNQYVDFELDKIVKPYRPIPSGLITREEALGTAWLLALFAVGRAFTINTFFGFIILILLFFAIFYSFPPFSPRKVNPILNTAWMAVSRGFLPMLAVWSIYGSLNQAWSYAFLAFIWVMGFQATKDLPDVEGDRKFDIKTIPNTWGLKGLLVLMGASLVTFSLLSLMFKLYIMLILVPLGLVSILTIKRKTKLTENTTAWVCFYLGLGLLYILMFMIHHF